jgi:hypothetical protein
MRRWWKQIRKQRSRPSTGCRLRQDV